MTSEEIVCIRTFQTRMEAELFQEFLRGQGIESVVYADDAGGMYPQFLMTTGGARVFVKKDQEEEARRRVAEFEKK